MAHKLDYSRSGAAVTWLYSPVNQRDAAPFNTEHWNSHGVVYENIRYYSRTDFPISQPQILTEQIAFVPYTAWAEMTTVDRDFLAGHDYGPYVAPPGFAQARTNFTIGSVDKFAASGAYMLFEGVAPLTSTFGSGLNRIYDSQEAAQAAAIGPLTTALHANLAADLERIEDRLLSSVNQIRVEYWTGDPAALVDQHLVITPDRNSTKKIGDLVDFNGPHAQNNLGYVAELSDVFGGDDLELVLTRHDDIVSYSTIKSRDLVIRAGAGHDTVLLVPDHTFAPVGRDDLSRTVLMDGGTGNDMLYGFAREKLELFGGDGNDTLWGEADRVIVRGGAGADDIWVSHGASTLWGEAGNDTIFGGTSTDLIYGGAGHDLLSEAQITFGVGSRMQVFYSSAITRIYGGAGNDTITGGGGSDLLYGGAGNDVIFGEAGDTRMYGGAGRDFFLFYNQGSRVIGDHSAHDKGGMVVLWDQQNGRQMLGRDDLLRAGDDLIIGDLGRASLRIVDYYDRPAQWTSGVDAGDGPQRSHNLIDWSYARSLRDPGIEGRARADTITMTTPGVASGGGGNDRITGSARSDTIFGDAGNDILRGRGGDDMLVGGLGNDRLLGAAGADTLVGNDGNDRLSGGAGRDVLYGGAGRDVLLGGAGDDRLFGGAGSDVLNGGRGSDQLTGGLGADRFVFGRGSGGDVILDFEPAGFAIRYSEGSGDRISLSSNLWSGDLTARQVVNRFGDIVSGDGSNPSLVGGRQFVLDFGRGDVLSFGDIYERSLIIDSIDILR